MLHKQLNSANLKVYFKYSYIQIVILDCRLAFDRCLSTVIDTRWCMYEKTASNN